VKSLHDSQIRDERVRIEQRRNEPEKRGFAKLALLRIQRSLDAVVETVSSRTSTGEVRSSKNEAEKSK